MLIYMWSHPISYLHHTPELSSESKYSECHKALHYFSKRMTVSMLHRTKIFFFWLSLLFTAICCHNKDDKLQVVGFIEHGDFAGSKVKVGQTFSGLHVTIGCRSTDGKIRTMGSSELNQEENFGVFLSQETVKDGVIRKDCYAQVHSTSDNSSCPLSNSDNTSNIIFQYKSKNKDTISHSGKVNFSPITCTSKFLWPFHKPKWQPILPPRFEYPPPQPPILTPETTRSPSLSPSGQPISTLSPPLPQPEDVPPAFSPANDDNPLPDTPVPVYTHPSPFPSPKLLPHKNYPPAFSSPPIPKSKQLPKLKGLSPAPAPSFDTPASPPSDEALPSSLSPSPLANNIPFPPHVPSFGIPQPPPIPTFSRPSPPAS